MDYDKVLWKDFYISDLVKVLPTKNILTKLKISDTGLYPVYSSDTKNNGIIGYCNKPDFFVNDDIPCYLIFGDHTRTLNIARTSFSVLDNVKVLIPSVNNDDALLYLITVWKKNIPNLGYARHWSIAKKCILRLPAKDDNTPDWEFMSNYIKKLKAEYIYKLEECLTVIGLKHYELTDKDKHLLEKHVRWKEFMVSDILSVEHTKSVISKNDLIDGNIPYVTRTAFNNGILCTCGNVDKINFGNCIIIGAESGLAFYQPNDFVAGNKIYKLSKNNLKENEYLFLVSALNKKASNYSYSNARIPEKIRKEIIFLPAKEDGTPDWEYMNQYICEIKKSVSGNLKEWIGQQKKQLKNLLNHDIII